MLVQEVHGNHFFRDVEGGGYWVESRRVSVRAV